VDDDRRHILNALVGTLLNADPQPAHDEYDRVDKLLRAHYALGGLPRCVAAGSKMLVLSVRARVCHAWIGRNVAGADAAGAICNVFKQAVVGAGEDLVGQFMPLLAGSFPTDSIDAFSMFRGAINGPAQTDGGDKCDGNDGIPVDRTTAANAAAICDAFTTAVNEAVAVDGFSDIFSEQLQKYAPALAPQQALEQCLVALRASPPTDRFCVSAAVDAETAKQLPPPALAAAP
jgi:hypothetical protein